jgi:hypothetical protein
MKREVASLRIRSIGKLQVTQTGKCSKRIANYRAQMEFVFGMF